MREITLITKKITVWGLPAPLPLICNCFKFNLSGVRVKGIIKSEASCSREGGKGETHPGVNLLPAIKQKWSEINKSTNQKRRNACSREKGLSNFSDFLFLPLFTIFSPPGPSLNGIKCQSFLLDSEYIDSMTGLCSFQTKGPILTNSPALMQLHRSPKQTIPYLAETAVTIGSNRIGSQESQVKCNGL